MQIQIILVIISVISTIIFNNTVNGISCFESSVKEEEVIEFKSPSFPNFLSGDLLCDVTINIHRNFKYLRIDFINVTMEGQGIFGDANYPGVCEADMFFFKGIGEWTPSPRCGELNGYSFLFSRKTVKFRNNSLKIVALMSSDKYRWHIRISHQKSRSLSERLHGRLHNRVRGTKRRKRKNQSRQDRLSRDLTVKYVSNGIPNPKYSFPWLASIRRKQVGRLTTIHNCPDLKSEGEHICGGTIISPFLIASAAHCFYGQSQFSSFQDVNNLKVVVGDYNVCNDNSGDSEFPSFDYDVESIIFHYGHDPNLKFHDIAIIKLKQNIVFMNHIKPIGLNNVDSLLGRRNGQIAGFGLWDHTNKDYWIERQSLRARRISKEYYPYHPQVSNVTIDSDLVCAFHNWNDFIRHNYSSRTFLQYDKYNLDVNTDLCDISIHVENSTTTPGRNGVHRLRDSGGPLVTYKNGTPLLKGIITKTKAEFFYNKANSTYFVAVAFYRKWIYSVAGSFGVQF